MEVRILFGFGSNLFRGNVIGIEDVKLVTLWQKWIEVGGNFQSKSLRPQQLQNRIRNVRCVAHH